MTDAPILSEDPVNSLAPRIERLFRVAKERWPGVEIEEGDFSARLGVLAEAATDWETLLTDERGVEVYLTLGCLAGDRRALSYFEEQYMRTLEIVWRRGEAVALDDDARQALRERLLVQTSGRQPKLAEFSGRGSLRNWLRIVALRQLADAAERKQPEVATEEGFFAALVSPGDDVQTEYAKALYRSSFYETFSSALASLPERDRSLLRYAVVKGLTLDELALVFAVHRATIARWLVDVRATLAKELRQALRARLAVDSSELDSILRIIESQIDLTLEYESQSTED